ncbi:RidA family protein [Nonomuraea sp. CA-218870]|uniref:RidA family protein n=1 Tax=Nonomuraea sp. CA-218870 TaxID=3239998 RepID=UPI003D8B8CC9
MVTGARRTVFVSGQVPWGGQGPLPEDFDSQCRLTWRNVLAVPAEAGMGVRNLAKVTTHLSDRRYREADSRVHQEVLGHQRLRQSEAARRLERLLEGQDGEPDTSEIRVGEHRARYAPEASRTQRLSTGSVRIRATTHPPVRRGTARVSGVPDHPPTALPRSAGRSVNPWAWARSATRLSSAMSSSAG